MSIDRPIENTVPNDEEQNKRTGNWSQMREAGSLSGIRFMFFVYRHFGRWVFALFLFPVIVYFFLLRGRARRASIDFLQRARAAGAPLPDQPIAWLSLRHFLSFGTNLLDKLAGWAGDVDPYKVGYEGRDEFLREVDKGRGVLVIVAHLGNLEISRMVADEKKRIKLNVLVHTKHAEKFNRMMRQVDAQSSLNLIQVTEFTPATAMVLQAKLDAGEVVVIAGDRTPVHGGARVSTAQFFNDKAPFPQGPYILASILKRPVFLMFCTKQASRYHIAFERFADLITLPRRSRDQAIDAWAQRFANRLEYHALGAPLQWFNFYDFWWSPAPDPSATSA